MLDITKAEADAKKELAEEAGAKAKTQIKASLKRIADAEAVVANAKRDHQVLLETIGAAG